MTIEEKAVVKKSRDDLMLDLDAAERRALWWHEEYLQARYKLGGWRAMAIGLMLWQWIYFLARYL